MSWRRPRRTRVEQQQSAIQTGVVIARLEAVVDRLEGAYERVETALDAQPRDERANGGGTQGTTSAI